MCSPPQGGRGDQAFKMPTVLFSTISKSVKAHARFSPRVKASGMGHGVPGLDMEAPPPAVSESGAGHKEEPNMSEREVRGVCREPGNKDPEVGEWKAEDTSVVFWTDTYVNIQKGTVVERSARRAREVHGMEVLEV